MASWFRFQPRGEISYGGFVLNSKPYSVDSVAYTTAQRRVERSNLLRAGSVRISTSFSEKTIALSGRIVAAGRTKQTMEQLLDNLERALFKPFQVFKMGYLDERYYDNTEIVDALEVEWSEEAKNVISWNAKILAPDPFAKSVATFSEASTGALATVSGTERIKLIGVRSSGTIFTYPTITITFPAGGGSPFGTTSVWVVNSSVSPPQSLRVTTNFAASDVLEINCEAQTVKLNTVLIDFEGSFPYVDPRLGSNSFELHSVSTSLPTIVISFSWRDRFLT